MPATPPLPDDASEIAAMARAVGYPVMLKASWGGGGRGMRVIEDDHELMETVATARREAKAAFGKDEVYLEKLIRRARHVEVQILGDSHGNLVHLYERDCTVQRRNQKVVERAPAAFLTDVQRQDLCEAALKIGRAVNYRAAGTVEFLQDADTGKFYFIEVNPRIQVEHTVTECVTGIDLVKAQIRIAAGARIGTPESGVPRQEDIHVTAHALQCRVTTEDPENSFVPDYGRVTAYRSPAGFGIRLDAGTAYAGAIITRYYDSLLVKVTAWSPTPDHAPALRDGGLHHEVHRSDAGALSYSAQARPGDAAAQLHRRCRRQRQSRGEGAGCAEIAGVSAAAAHGVARGAAARYQAKIGRTRTR
jgi:pyruvate carboxylase